MQAGRKSLKDGFSCPLSFWQLAAFLCVPEPFPAQFGAAFLCVPEPLPAHSGVAFYVFRSLFFLQARNRLRVLTELFLGTSAARIRDRLKGCIKPFTHSWNHHFSASRTYVQFDEKITRT